MLEGRVQNQPTPRGLDQIQGPTNSMGPNQLRILLSTIAAPLASPQILSLLQLFWDFIPIMCLKT